MHKGNVGGTPPSWRTLSEALRVCAYRPNRRRIYFIALTVGTLLVVINQGGVVMSGNVDMATWVRIGADYLTPACVSTMGLLAGSKSG